MKKILIQLDTDPLPSSFDRVVAVDAGVDELFSYGGVTPQNVVPLVHGAMFTRGLDDLKSTAIFIGGSQAQLGEELLKKVQKTFFGPVRVSAMMDSNGSNTTAAAAVLAAGDHLKLTGAEALVLGGTGPVGQRAVQLLASQGANVRVASRSLARAEEVCRQVKTQHSQANLTPLGAENARQLAAACEGVQLLIAAGAAGVQFLSADQWNNLPGLQVAIDLNAVPPLGLEGIDVMDKARTRNNVVCYGAIGVGGRKMKIHKAALKRLFEGNQFILDTAAIYEIGQSL